MTSFEMFLEFCGLQELLFEDDSVRALQGRDSRWNVLTPPPPPHPPADRPARNPDHPERTG